MKKIGILTFHYSNNYGGVLQAFSLYKVIESMGYDVEIINFVPSTYKPTKINNGLGLRRNIFKNRFEDMNIFEIFQKIRIIKKNSSNIIDKFDKYRAREMKLSNEVDENSLKMILSNYGTIIVGSDQVWNPGQRKMPEYFLNFGDYFSGNKISYAADSTTKEVDVESIQELKTALEKFSFISVRNEHSYEFVQTVINDEVPIVADPTILYEFKGEAANKLKDEKYILTYILGEEIEGTHIKALEEIKKTYGNLPVYAIKIPTMKFELSDFANKVFYDLDPDEWINMFRNAKFVYTDSFHGVLFSLKFHVPFLAYYREKLRATRFIDLGKRYNIEKYIVQNIEEIERKQSIKVKPDFDKIDILLGEHKKYSLELFEKILRN